MYTFDETGWTAIEKSAAGDTSLADVEEYIARWESWLERGETFSVIVTYEDEEYGKVEKDARKLSNHWHKENRERVGEACAGIVGVVKSSKLLALYKPVVRRAMEKKMGCPGAVFDNETEARARLEECFTEKEREKSVPAQK